MRAVEVGAAVAPSPEVQRLHGEAYRLERLPDWGMATFTGPHSDDKHRKLIEARADLTRCLDKLQYLLDGTRRW